MIVVLTGVADARLVKDLIMRGVDDIMIKPISPHILVSKCVAMLDRRGAQVLAGADLSSPELVSRRISSVRQTLEQQLAQVTGSFQSTISALERQQKETEAGLVGSIRLFTGLLGKMGSTGSSHAERVEQISAELGRAVGMSEPALKDLSLAALLHDIGQFGMPDDIRASATWNLTPEQRKGFEMYPELGAALLGEVPGLSSVAATIQAHCENFDGSGFPNQLKGEGIPLAARILRLADGCDNIYMSRKEERPLEVLREHLTEQSALAYDPLLVPRALSVLVRVYRELLGEPEAVAASNLSEGYLLAEDVYDHQGRLLARSGMRITFQLRQHLARFLGDEVIHVLPPEGG